MNKMFIDLEGVIIDTWHAGNFILDWTSEQLRLLVVQYGVRSVELFSYAVDNDKDKLVVQPILKYTEQIIDVEFSNIITVENVIEIINWTEYMFTLKQRGKRFGFIEYVRNIALLDDTVDNYILLDDSVEDEVVDMGSYKIIFRQIV